jgi:hypothetical protein
VAHDVGIVPEDDNASVAILDTQDQALVGQVSELNLPAVEIALRIFGGRIVWNAADLKEESVSGDDESGE